MPTPRERVVDAIQEAEQRARDKGGGGMRVKEEVIEGLTKLVVDVETEAIELVERANGAVVRAVEAAYEDAAFALMHLPKTSTPEDAVRAVQEAKTDALRGAKKGPQTP